MIREHLFNSLTGTVRMKGTTKFVPSKFIIGTDEVECLNTGYRGSESYQTDLTNFLSLCGLPNELIISTPWYNSPDSYPGNFDLTFFKNTTTESVFVSVYSPLSGNVWCYTLYCPNTSCSIITELSTVCVSTSCVSSLYQMTSTYARTVYVADYNDSTLYTVNSAFTEWIPVSSECHPPTITTELSTGICPINFHGYTNISRSVSTTYCTNSAIYGPWITYSVSGCSNECVQKTNNADRPTARIQYGYQSYNNPLGLISGALRLKGTTYETPARYTVEVSGSQGSAYYDTEYRGLDSSTYRNSLSSYLNSNPLYGTYNGIICTYNGEIPKYGNFDFTVFIPSTSYTVISSWYMPLGNYLYPCECNIYCLQTPVTTYKGYSSVCVSTSCSQGPLYQMMSTYNRNVYTVNYSDSTWYTVNSCYDRWIPLSAQCYPPTITTVLSTSSYYMGYSNISCSVSTTYCTNSAVYGQWIMYNDVPCPYCISCGSTNNVNAGSSTFYPLFSSDVCTMGLYHINIGTNIGNITLSAYNAGVPVHISSVWNKTPDGWIAWTGSRYIGNSSYNNEIQHALTAIYDQSPFNFDLFPVYKDFVYTATRTSDVSEVIVWLRAPLSGAQLSFKLTCPS